MKGKSFKKLKCLKPCLKLKCKSPKFLVNKLKFLQTIGKVLALLREQMGRLLWTKFDTLRASEASEGVYLLRNGAEIEYGWLWMAGVQSGLPEDEARAS